jgi:soluble lytic murein transglycosylase-like protein
MDLPMNFNLRQPFALAAAVALLALPLAPFSSQTATAAGPSVVPPKSIATAVAPAPNQTALAEYIASRYRKPMPYAAGIVRTTFEEAKRYALPPGLLLGMMEKESGFNATAQSSYGATGLMQVVPRFHMERLKKTETESSFKNPRTNIRVAAHILAEYIAAHKDLDKALKKYSGSSRGYSRQVRSNWKQFEQMGRTSAPVHHKPN